MAVNPDVIVVGAGVIGCSVAYYLTKQGAKVTLLERESIGSGASAHATGSLSLLGAEFSPGPSFNFALAAHREFPGLVRDLEEETGMDLLFQQRPSLRLALDEEEEATIKGLMACQEEHVAMRWIDAAEVMRIEPRLTNKVRGAVYEEQSAQLDSYRLTLALGQAAEKRGAQLQLRPVTDLITSGSRIIGVRTAAGEIACDTVILAAGVWSTAFSETLGYQIPVQALKGERLMLRFPGEPLPVLISSPKRGHMISRLDGMLSVGSTGGRDYDQQDLFLGDEFDRQPTESARTELLQRAIDVLPALEDAELVQQLAGSRPLSPDTFPIIGPMPGWEGVILATGHGTKGVHLGPVTGRTLAEYVMAGCVQVPELLEAFSPARFSAESDPDFYAAGQRAEE